MTPAARLSAAITVMDRILAGELADRTLSDWGRKNRYAGSKDRAAIGDIVYDVLRRKTSYALLGGGETGRALVLGYVRASGQDPMAIFGADRYAPSALTEAEQQPPAQTRAQLQDIADFPDWLWPVLVRSHGAEALTVAQALQDRAPVHLRVNLRKSNQAQAIAALADAGVHAEPHAASPTALQVLEGARQIRNSAAYRDGVVELQDASSQAIADLVPLQAGETLLDLCAGGGGKVLAVAGRVDGKFYAHDIDPCRMKDLPARAVRAGVGVEILPNAPQGQEFDTVLVDAPCSGSGSWRRDPQGKWLLTPEAFQTVQNSQREILRQAAGLVKSGGHLVYATCSVLDCENELAVKKFLSENSDFTLQKERYFSPVSGGDGFYGAVLLSA